METFNFSESDEFKKLKSENELLIREAVQATVERKELQEARNEIELIKTALSSMSPETLFNFISKAKENSEK